MLDFRSLRPLQAMAATLFFKHKRLLLSLPRQYGGKTELGVRLLHDLTRRPSTSSSLFLAKSHKARKKATREKFLRIFDQKTFAVNSELIYLRKFPTSQIFMGAVDRDPDGERGGTHSMVHWSEVAFAKLEHGETIIDVFGKVVKPTLSLTDGYALLESTNNGQNGWKDIWDSYRDFKFHRLKVPFSQMLEMGLVSQEDYDKEKSETLPAIFRQEYECEWVTFQGKVYEEFDEDFHVDPNMPPPEEWQRVISAIDWGYHPSATCVLFAYVKDGVLNVFDEIYEHKQLIDETYTSINSRLVNWRIQSYAAVADHEQDRIDELNRRGIACSLANKVNVLGARLQIKEMLWKGLIKFHPRCKMTLKDIAAAVWHDKKEGELDPSMCTWGHWDAEAALRYLVRELSEFETEEPEINPHKTTDDVSARAWNIERAIS